MSLIKALNEITAHDLTRVGGKALNCARLLQAGLPVPDGFVVLAGAEDGFSLGAELDVFLKEGARRQPDFDAVVMKQVGHYPMLERPDELDRHIAAVVESLLTPVSRRDAAPSIAIAGGCPSRN